MLKGCSCRTKKEMEDIIGRWLPWVIAVLTDTAAKPTGSDFVDLPVKTSSWLAVRSYKNSLCFFLSVFKAKQMMCEFGACKFIAVTAALIGGAFSSGWLFVIRSLFACSFFSLRRERGLFVTLQFWTMGLVLTPSHSCNVWTSGGFPEFFTSAFSSKAEMESVYYKHVC